MCLNTVAPDPPAKERLTKTVLPWRQMNLFQRDPARSPLMESNQTRGMSSTQAQTTTSEESARTSRSKEAQVTKTCKPYLMNLAIPNHSNASARVLRIPASTKDSVRHPKTKQKNSRNGSVLNRFNDQNGRERVNSGSPRNVSSRRGSQHDCTPDSTNKKRVRFLQDSRQN